MADDRCQSYQSTSPRERRAWWKSGHGTHKRGLNTKIHLAVDANGMPVRVLITKGTRADCKEAIHLIEGISAENLLADRGYDTNKIVAYATSVGMKVLFHQRRIAERIEITMNICTEFGIWLRTLSSSSSGGVASRLAMRKPVMDSSLQSWCVASPFGRTFLHNLCKHYLNYTTSFSFLSELL